MAAWGALAVVFLFIHCYKLGEIPYGINVDEMGMAYDAWCLSHYGTDRYLNSFPVYLTNYGGGQSALYAYLCAPFVYVLGITTVAIRIPAVLFSVLTLVYLVKTADLIWHNKLFNYLVALFYTIAPVFLFLARIGLDCNLMLGAMTVFLYYFLKAVKNGQNRDFVLAGIFGGMVLYTYVLSHLMIPVFLIITFCYLLWLRKVTMRQVLEMGIPMFFLAFPLILFQLVNMTDGREMKLGIFTITKLYGYRGSEVALKEIAENLWKFFKYTLGHDYVRFNSVPNFYNMYAVSIPIIVLGFVSAVRKAVISGKQRVLNPLYFIVAWFVSVYAVGITLSTGGPTIYRMNAVYVAYALLWIEGLTVVIQVVGRLTKKTVRHLIYGCGIAGYLIAFLSFGKYYFTDYVKDTYLIDLFNFTFEDVLVYIEDELPQGVSDRMTYIGDGNQTYMFYLCSTMTSPYDYNETPGEASQDLTRWTESFKNYYFNFPEKIDPAGNYIVPDTSARYVEEYEAYGMEKIHIGNHYLFWNPWLSEEVSNTENLISWDHGMDTGQGIIVYDEGDSTTISGWALDVTHMKKWDDVIIEVDGKHIVAEKMKREDVAKAMKNDELTECGFTLRIPNEVLQSADRVKVRFINYEEDACYVEHLK